MMGKYAALVLAFTGSFAAARPAQVGDRIVLNRSVRMEAPEKLRVPQVNFKSGTIVSHAVHTNWQCSLSPDGDQFENKFGNVRDYATIELEPKVFTVAGVWKDNQEGKDAYLFLESSTGGTYTLICSRYTGEVSVEFSTDSALISGMLGSYGTFVEKSAQPPLSGRVTGRILKYLKL